MAQSSSASAVQAGTSIPNRASDLNPDDIESVEILKGAASGAIYGARSGPPDTLQGWKELGRVSDASRRERVQLDTTRRRLAGPLCGDPVGEAESD